VYLSAPPAQARPSPQDTSTGGKAPANVHHAKSLDPEASPASWSPAVSPMGKRGGPWPGGEGGPAAGRGRPGQDGAAAV